MKYIYKIILSLMLISVQCFSVTLYAQNKGEKNKIEPCPDEIEWIGEYRNYAYDFSMIIPAGRKGYWNSARCVKDEKYGCICMKDHGRIIPLSNSGYDKGYIEVYAGYVFEEGVSFPNDEKKQILDLRKQKQTHSVKLLKSKTILLDNLKARRFLIKFVEKGQTKIIDRIVALSLSKSIQYSLVLNTFLSDYKLHKSEFDSLVDTWKLTSKE